MCRARSNCQMVRLSVSSRWSGVHDSRWSGVRGLQVVRYPGGQIFRCLGVQVVRGVANSSLDPAGHTLVTANQHHVLIGIKLS